MSQIPWWVFPLNIAIGASLGFAIAEYRDWRRRQRQRVGHFEALAAEIQICAEMAKGYVDGTVKAPSYRMPQVAYQRSFAALLSDGVLNFSETAAIARFYVAALSFNFSVDQAQMILMKKEEDRPPRRVGLESGRARMKALNLRKDSDRLNLYVNAIDVVRRRLPKDSQGRLSLAEEDLREEAEE